MRNLEPCTVLIFVDTFPSPLPLVRGGGKKKVPLTRGVRGFLSGGKRRLDTKHTGIAFVEICQHSNLKLCNIFMYPKRSDTRDCHYKTFVLDESPFGRSFRSNSCWSTKLKISLKNVRSSLFGINWVCVFSSI